MNLPNLPRFVWWVIGVVIVLAIIVLLKVNIQLGSNGFSITQGVVH